MNNSDSWQTPQELFEELNKEFHFDIDLCATKENSKCNIYGFDYLTDLVMYKNSNCVGTLKDEIKLLKNVSCFMNPPYSNPKPFIEKAWEDSKHCKIVCLVPNTIKTCKYMDVLDANKGESTFRQWLPGIEIRDLTRRTAFYHPDKVASSPSFGCMLLILDRRGL